MYNSYSNGKGSGSITHNPSSITQEKAIQCKLWERLTPEQQEYVQPVFRKLKNHVQIGLSKALLAYMEDGYVCKFSDVPTATLFLYLTGHGLDKKEPGMVTYKRLNGEKVNGLKSNNHTKEPERIGDIINRIFGSFSHLTR